MRERSHRESERVAPPQIDDLNGLVGADQLDVRADAALLVDDPDLRRPELQGLAMSSSSSLEQVIPGTVAATKDVSSPSRPRADLRRLCRRQRSPSGSHLLSDPGRRSDEYVFRASGASARSQVDRTLTVLSPPGLPGSSWRCADTDGDEENAQPSVSRRDQLWKLEADPRTRRRSCDAAIGDVCPIGAQALSRRAADHVPVALDKLRQRDWLTRAPASAAGLRRTRVHEGLRKDAGQ